MWRTVRRYKHNKLTVNSWTRKRSAFYMQQKGHRGRKTQRTKKGENNLPIPRTFFDESVPLLPPLSSGNSADESALLSVHVPFRFVPDVRRYT